MGCTCGSSGALDGHSPFCDLRKVSVDTPSNRVVVGLPERLSNAKTAVSDLEGKLEEIRRIVVAWRSGDTYLGWTHNAMKEVEKVVNK